MSTKTGTFLLRAFSAFVLLSLLFGPATVTHVRAAGILYATSTGTGDCSSWANACALRTALTTAVSGAEIWVAAGTHKPTTGSNRTATFQLKDGVALYGGFAGTETTRDQRDPAANLTILSGDLNGNDVGFINNTENTYHVVTGASGATLDGFTVTAGNANTSSPNDRGGGLYNATGSPTLMNITFSGNWASYGGGVYSGAGSPTLTNITFRNNSTGAIDTFGKGGGMYNAISSNPVLTNVTFAGNQAKYGGGMFNDYNNSPRLTNVTFSNNSAYYGGGMYNDSNSSSQISNTIFWGNTAPNGAQIYNSNSTPSVSDSVVQNGYAGGTNILTTDPLLGVLANYGSFTQTVPLLPGSSAIDTGNDANCPASDQRGVSRPQGAQCDIGAFEAADTVVLDTRIDTHPGNPSYTAEPNFTFFGSSSIGSAVTFECALDGSTFAGCVSPQSYTGLINGFHTFAARAKDGAGNLDATPATYTWTITINEAVLYVTPSGTGDCSSWTNACTLQAALTGAIGGDEIWVAAGTYKPTTGTNRSASFQLKNGVAIYGGFAGTETARNQRDPAVNPTMLSGDLNGNDNGNVAYNEPTRADNSYHVVIGTTGATLNGVTITAGNANGTSPSHRGGGMYNYVSSPTLTNVIFSGNSANLGGGMFNATSSDPALTNVTFSDNSAQSGGGVYNNASNPTLTNATFSNNSAYFYGGGMYNYSNSNPTLTNVTLSNNSAYDKGGGMYNDTNSNPQISNTIFWGNTAPNRAQIYNYSSIPSISDSVVQGGYAGGTNILTTDPLLGTLGNYGSFTPTIPLLPGSSAIDTGNDVNCPASDQRGITRPQGTQCDIGAFEYADTAVLDTQIEIHPGNPSFTSQPSFTFSGSSSAGGAVTFECSLDGAAFAACVSPQNYTGLVDGPHTFTVRTTDLAGNQDATPASYAWMITNHVAMIRYATSSGTGDCSSWANACALQTALTGAISGDELWVAAGTYKPTLGSDRGISFQLKEGVALYGGFAGVETTRDQRDPAANVTILSGDIDNNDSQTPIITDIKTVTGNATNSYHVVTGASSATLDGFIITAGYANGTYPNNVGGGMHNSYSSPTLTNIVFIGNSAYYNGGGIRNSYGSNPRLTNVTFKSNLTSHYGGGMDNNASSPVLLNVTFSDNRAYDNGGGIYNNDSAPILTNVTFNSNSADNNGGGMYNDSSNPTLMNVTFNGNSAYNGGGLYNFYYSAPTLTNTTFSNNKATNGSGGGLFNAFVSSPQIRNTILWGNRASSAAQIYNSGSILSIRDSVVQGGYAGGVNILTTDPLLGMPGNYGGFTQTIPLLPGSSAIDTGNEALCPTSDQRGVSRPQGAYCDIGAFEYDAPIYTSIYFVKPIASGAGDCSSWANACTLQTALAGASKDNELWVAAGTYKPTTGSDRNVSFQLKDDVAIYGGFAGTETSRTQRNPQANVTVLSGDIDNNDNQTPIITDLATVIGNTTNSYHVVTGASDATLEDFAITAGYANGAYPNNDGGGMYNYQSSPTLTNLTFSGNSATNGGGMFNENGSRPTLTSVNFSNNSADSNGGGMDNKNSNPVLMDVAFSYNAVGSYGGGMQNYFSSPILTNVTFSNNSADQGGGIHNYSSSPALMNVTFNGNSAIQGGGMFNESGIESSSSPTLTNVTFSDNSAIFDGGGMHNYSSSPALMNVTFNGNSASQGGGMFNESGSESSSSPTLTNVTFSDNSAIFDGGGMQNYYSSPILTNVTFSNNSADQGGGIHNYSSSPALMNVTFNGNSAIQGGGMFNESGSESSSSPTLTNVTFSDNSAIFNGGGIFNNSTSDFNAHNTIFWGNVASRGAQIFCYSSDGIPVINDSVVEGGCPAGSTCTNIITTDPLLGPLGDYGGFTQTLPILAGSSAIDAGNDAVCPAADQRGVTRPQGAHCDIGAYETVDPTAPIVTVFTTASPSNSLNIPITVFTATDNVSVTGYLITESAAIPGADDAGWTASAPTAYTVARDGSYTLYPWAKDAIGNVSFIFGSPGLVMVDTIAPDTQIDSKPADPSNSAEATFTFSSADATASFECSLEGGAFAACASPKNYSGLIAGSHTFAVRAKDLAGNLDASPASYTWTIDLTAPNTQIDSKPADPSNSAGATFTFSSDELVTTFECSLDGSDFEGCASPKNYAGLANGSHTFVVQAKDLAGNTDATPASYTWTIDLTIPTVVSSLRANPSPTNAASVDFTVTFSEPVSGVDAADFFLTSTGTISAASLTNVSGSGATYTITVSTGTGAGSLRLDVPATATIEDLAANPLSGLPYTSGQAYSVRTQTFADVPITHSAWSYIERLYAAGITGGCGGGNYCPNNSVTRAQMAVFLLRGMHGSSYVPPAATGTVFGDVPVSHPQAAWIEQLNTEGISGGCGGGNYCPANPVTRAQMAVFLLRAKHGSAYIPPAASGTMFADVPISHPQAAWIEQLSNEGISGGCGAGNYCPGNPVTRAQMAIFLVRAFNLP